VTTPDYIPVADTLRDVYFLLAVLVLLASEWGSGEPRTTNKLLEMFCGICLVCGVFFVLSWLGGSVVFVKNGLLGRVLFLFGVGVALCWLTMLLISVVGGLVLWLAGWRLSLGLVSFSFSA